GCAPPAGGRKRGLWEALAREKAAEIGHLAAEAARSLGCGDAGLGAAESVIRAGMLQAGGGILGQLLAAEPGCRGAPAPCGQGHAAAFCAVQGRAALITARKLVPLPPSPLPDKLYAAIDGTGVPVTAKETAGRDGKGEDGRARTREVKLAVFFTQDKTDDKGYPVRDPGSS